MAHRTHAGASPVPLNRALVAPTSRRADEARADELDAGVWCLRLPLPYPVTRWVNAFLLATEDGWTLIDCGSGIGDGWGALTHALRLAGVEPGAIATLVLTHLHADHASLAGELARRVGCRVVRHRGPDTVADRPRDLRLPLEERRAIARAEGVPEHELDDIVDAPIAGDGRQPHPPVDVWLADGDVLRTRAGEWQVLSMPGHSPQQVALYEPRRRWLLAADVAYADIRPYIEWGHSPDPYGEYVASLERADALGAALVLPSHGRPDPGPAHRFASARAAVASAAAVIVAEVGDEPRSGYEIACAMVGHEPDPDVRGSWLAVSLAVLEHLGARGEIGWETGDDGIRRFASA